MDSLFHRLLGALLAKEGPAGSADPGRSDAVLVAHQHPLAVVERPEDGAGIVILDDAGVAPEELRHRLDRILQSHQAGVLFMVVTGGGAAAKAVLLESDRTAPDPKRLGVYHLDESGRLEHLAGRRLRPLEEAGRRIGQATPLDPAQAPALITRGERDRQEAARFAALLGGRAPRATFAIVGACVLLYILAWHWGGRRFTEALVLMGANSGPLVAEGQVWRLLASAFLHGSVLHLLVNMIALQSFGGFLEAVLGWRRYLVLYTVTALAGSLASALVTGNPLSVGASGAVWGLMAGGFGLLRRPDSPVPPRIASRLRGRLVVVLVLNGLISFLPGIDFSAHFGGGIAGWLLAQAGVLRATGGAAPDLVPRWLRSAAIASALAMALSVLIALAVGRPWTLSSRLLSSSSSSSSSSSAWTGRSESPLFCAFPGPVLDAALEHAAVGRDGEGRLFRRLPR